MTPAFPKRGPDAGTMDQVRPHCAAWHQTTLTVDWPTYPLQTPSGGGLAPTPDRSKTPAKGFLASGEEGLTNQGPLQKARRIAPRRPSFAPERRNALPLIAPYGLRCYRPHPGGGPWRSMASTISRWRRSVCRCAPDAALRRCPPSRPRSQSLHSSRSPTRFRFAWIIKGVNHDSYRSC